MDGDMVSWFARAKVPCQRCALESVRTYQKLILQLGDDYELHARLYPMFERVGVLSGK
jgi:hypothetical protein